MDVYEKARILGNETAATLLRVEKRAIPPNHNEYRRLRRACEEVLLVLLRDNQMHYNWPVYEVSQHRVKTVLKAAVLKGFATKIKKGTRVFFEITPLAHRCAEVAHSFAEER